MSVTQDFLNVKTGGQIVYWIDGYGQRGWDPSPVTQKPKFNSNMHL